MLVLPVRGHEHRSMSRYALICALPHQRRQLNILFVIMASGDILGGPPSSREGRQALECCTHTSHTVIPVPLNSS